MHHNLSETQMIGSDTWQQVVRANQSDLREWLQNAPACSALNTHRMLHVGICHAQAPYRIVRMQQSGTYFMACTEGEGYVLVDGKWRSCKAGSACILPSHMLNAFYAKPGKTWKFSWVRYESGSETQPIVTSHSPMLAPYPGDALQHAIAGLWHETQQSNHLAQLHQWVELIQSYVIRFVQPWHSDDRLTKVWEQVEKDLAHAWDIPQLAQIACMSGEHLRRCCLTQLGRPPLRHLTWLRMRRAADLLSSSDEKIETIAYLVGYKNPFVFSNTFTKWIGWRPSQHRLQSR